MSSKKFIEDAESLLDRRLMTSDGVSKELIDDAAKRLGRKLPIRLTEFYQSVGNIGTFTSAYNRFILPKDLEAKGGMIAFLHEKQNICIWGIKMSDESDDPKVFYTANHTDDAPTWFEESITLSQFLRMMAFYQCAESGYLYKAQTENNIEDILNEVDREWQLVVKHNVLTIYRKDQSLIWYLLDNEPTVDMLTCSTLRKEDCKALCEKYGFVME